MQRYWITLISGDYGYLFAEKKPLPGTWVTIWVETLMVLNMRFMVELVGCGNLRDLRVPFSL